MNLNAEIKDYWEGESVVYSECVQEELDSGFQPDAWRKLILDNAPGNEHLDILDCGTGPGFFPIILGTAGHTVTGIDLTENMIARARENVKKYTDAGADIQLMTMDCASLTFPDESFDLVICRNITWTLDDPQKAYREWKRVLRPGGRMLVFDSCWYLHLYDEEKKKSYDAHNEYLLKKYGRPKHQHANKGKDEELAPHLFMSDKVRPLWDMGYLMEIGFTKVFAQPDLSDLLCDERGKDFNKLTPPFMAGAEK